MFRKISDLIFQDVKNENETKKVAVTLRVSALILCIYFLSLFAAFCIIGDVKSAIMCIFCCVSYGLSFYTTYLNRTKFASTFSQMLMVLWIMVFIWEFGWDCGVQHFVFVLLVLNFTVSTNAMQYKILAAVLACAYRILLYAYTSRYEPFTTLSHGASVMFQIINTVFIFAELTAILIIFTKDSQEMEQKLIKYNEKLERLASLDPLTGLYNRRRMRQYLDQVEAEYSPNGMKFLSLALGDIDFFKKVNDSYGHETGDQVLKSVAKLFMKAIDGKGEVCRWGGEEFLIAFYDMNGDEALVLLTEILEQIRSMEVVHDGKRIHITMTFGLVEYHKASGVEGSIQEADKKLYRGKESGRNQIVY